MTATVETAESLAAYIAAADSALAKAGAKPRKAKVVAAKAEAPVPAVTQTVEEAPAAPARDRRNGVLRPAEGSVSAKIWALADAFVAEHGREPKPGDLRETAMAQGINLTSLGLGMGYRRKFNKG